MFNCKFWLSVLLCLLCAGFAFSAKTEKQEMKEILIEDISVYEKDYPELADDKFLENIDNFNKYYENLNDIYDDFLISGKNNKKELTDNIDKLLKCCEKLNNVLNKHSLKINKDFYTDRYILLEKKIYNNKNEKLGNIIFRRYKKENDNNNIVTDYVSLKNAISAISKNKKYIKPPKRIFKIENQWELLLEEETKEIEEICSYIANTKITKPDEQLFKDVIYLKPNGTILSDKKPDVLRLLNYCKTAKEKNKEFNNKKKRLTQILSFINIDLNVDISNEITWADTYIKNEPSIEYKKVWTGSKDYIMAVSAEITKGKNQENAIDEAKRNSVKEFYKLCCLLLGKEYKEENFHNLTEVKQTEEAADDYFTEKGDSNNYYVKSYGSDLKKQKKCVVVNRKIRFNLEKIAESSNLEFLYKSIGEPRIMVYVKKSGSLEELREDISYKIKDILQKQFGANIQTAQNEEYTDEELKGKGKAKNYECKYLMIINPEYKDNTVTFNIEINDLFTMSTEQIFECMGQGDDKANAYENTLKDFRKSVAGEMQCYFAKSYANLNFSPVYNVALDIESSEIESYKRFCGVVEKLCAEDPHCIIKYDKENIKELNYKKVNGIYCFDYRTRLKRTEIESILGKIKLDRGKLDLKEFSDKENTIKLKLTEK